jgi:hypothetical protein
MLSRKERFRHFTASASKHAKDWAFRSRELGELWQYSKVSVWKNQRDFERTLAALPRHQDELDAFSESIGQGFLALASSLEKMTKFSEQLVPESERLLKLSNGDFEGEAVLESAATLLKPALDFVDECSERVGEIAKRLEFCRSNIRELLTLQGTLASVIAPLNYIETLFKIECASLPESVQALFISVTSEISQLEKKVEAMFAEKFAALTAVERSLNEVLERLQASVTTQARLVREGRAENEAMLEQLREQIAQNDSRRERLTSRTQQLSGKVSAIVTSLQSQDIVSQKIAHVIRDLEEFDHTQCGSRSLFSRNARLQKANELARVQALQLEAVTSETQSAHREIFRSLDEVLAVINETHAGATALEEYRTVTSSTDTMIGGLQQSIQNAGTMMAQVLGEADSVFKIVESIGQSANALTATIMELSVSMHFIALNAQIQAVQIGAGTGLEMLSARTAALSAETSSLSDQARQGLERVARVMAEIIDDFNLLRNDGLAQRQSLGETGGRLESKLLALRDQNEDCLRQVSESTAGIQNECEAMRADLPDERAIGDHLAPTRAFLNEVMELTRESLLAQTRKLSEYEREALKKKYTMESERLAHEGAITGELANIETALKTEAEIKIDLFAEEKTETAAPAPVAAAPDSAEGSIELF